MRSTGSDAFESRLVTVILTAVREGRPVHIRADHDGVSTPLFGLADEAFPIPELLEAYERLALCPGIDVGIVTGRSLSFARQRYPNPRIDLECSYGLQSRRGGIDDQHAGVLECQPRLDEFLSLAQVAIAATGGRWARKAAEARDRDAVYIDRKDVSVVLAWGFGDPFHADALAREAVRRACRRLEEDGTARRLGLVVSHALDNVEFAANIIREGGPVDKGAVMRAFPGGDLLIYAGDGPPDEPAKKVVDERGGIFMAVNNEGTPPALLEGSQVFDNPEQFAHCMNSVSRTITLNVRGL